MAVIEEPTESTARRVIAGTSVFVVVAVATVLYALPRAARGGTGPDPLATVNAVLNGSSALGLLLGYAAIRRKRVAVHRACMTVSFGLSSVFLVTYLIHHARVGSVHFAGHGWARGLYFLVLVPHVLLAMIIVPLALVTLRRGWLGDVARHRHIARRTLPIWLYVSVSGVVLYLMLYR